MMKTFLQVFVAGVIILALTGCNSGHLRERNPQPSDRRFTPSQKQKRPNFHSHPDLALHHRDEVLRCARQFNIDHRFLLALIQSESSGRCGAVSPDKAYGLFQLRVPTARNYDPAATGRRLLKADYNIFIACRHYRWLKHQIDHRFGDASEYQKLMLIVAAWNAGIGEVIKHNGIPHFRESKTLVRRVAKKYDEYVRLGV